VARSTARGRQLSRTTRPEVDRSRSRFMTAVAAMGVAGVSLLHASLASAELPPCIDAHTAGQTARNEGHLRRAAQLFTDCGADAKCPLQVRMDCSKFLDQNNKSLPTVIFAVVDSDGKDIMDVKVFSDAEQVATSLNCRAVELDPGPHHLRFVLPEGRELTEDVLIREGEKQRLVRVSAGSTTPSLAPPDSASPSPPIPAPAIPFHAEAAPPALRPSGRPPVGAWIAGGGAVLALATGVTLGLVGAGKQDQLEQCRPNCPNSKRATYDNAKAIFLGADISFGVAAVATGVATWLFLSRPSVGAESIAGSGERVTVGVSPARGGGTVVLGSVF
jgi:hypothetical protein